MDSSYLSHERTCRIWRRTAGVDRVAEDSSPAFWWYRDRLTSTYRPFVIPIRYSYCTQSTHPYNWNIQDYVKYETRKLTESVVALLQMQTAVHRACGRASIALMKRLSTGSVCFTCTPARFNAVVFKILSMNSHFAIRTKSSAWKWTPRLWVSY